MTKLAKMLSLAALGFALTGQFALAATVAGEVKKVDAAANKITLKHGKIPNLDMDAMTMVFKAAKPEMLSGLKPGDKVKFDADSINGELTVTEIEKAK